MSLARKYERQLTSQILDIERVTTEKVKDPANKRIWWVLKDGSAIGLDINEIIYVSDNYKSNKTSNFNKPLRRV